MERLFSQGSGLSGVWVAPKEEKYKGMKVHVKTWQRLESSGVGCGGSVGIGWAVFCASTNAQHTKESKHL